MAKLVRALSYVPYEGLRLPGDVFEVPDDYPEDNVVLVQQAAPVSQDAGQPAEAERPVEVPAEKEETKHIVNPGRKPSGSKSVLT